MNHGIAILSNKFASGTGLAATGSEWAMAYREFGIFASVIADCKLALSKRRADPVVRCLADQSKVPFYQIHLIGTGAQQLVNAGTSREARANNRRADARMHKAEEAKAVAANSDC